MKKKDVDLDRGTIRIPNSKTGQPGWAYLNRTLLEVLDPIIKTLPSPESPIFDWANFEDLWQQAKRKAGLQHFVFHHLRHTAASWLALKTGNLFLVKCFLRHASLAMTNRYAHIDGRALREAVCLLDKSGGHERPPKPALLSRPLKTLANIGYGSPPAIPKTNPLVPV